MFIKPVKNKEKNMNITQDYVTLHFINVYKIWLKSATAHLSTTTQQILFQVTSWIFIEI